MIYFPRAPPKKKFSPQTDNAIAHMQCNAFVRSAVTRTTSTVLAPRGKASHKYNLDIITENNFQRTQPCIAIWQASRLTRAESIDFQGPKLYYTVLFLFDVRPKPSEGTRLARWTIHFTLEIHVEFGASCRRAWWVAPSKEISEERLLCLCAREYWTFVVKKEDILRLIGWHYKDETIYCNCKEALK